MGRSSPLNLKGKIQFCCLLKCVFYKTDFRCLYPQGPNKAAVLCSTVFFFPQINIFPKDLNPKQQPRFKSNTSQKFRSRVIQHLQVLGMVQSVVVYSIAKIFAQTLCLYMASYTSKHCETMETCTVPFKGILFWSVWIVEMAIKTPLCASQSYYFH